MSRHQCDVATWDGLQEVATWKRCRDLGGLAGQGREVATCAHNLGTMRATCTRHARDQLAVRTAAPTTWALCAQCARDLGFGCAHSAPNPVLVQCTICSHCLGNCSWTLFMNTFHMDKRKKRKKKEYKIFKNFLVYDFIYEIFILHLLQLH